MNNQLVRPPGLLGMRRRGSAVTLTVVALAVTGALVIGASPAEAANNPGTGDTGFFTFRPTTQNAGSQVNVASGNLLVRSRDLSDSLLNYGVVVDRAYNSLAPSSFSILSPRWSFDVGPTTKITEQSNGNADMVGPSGYSITFARQTDGSYQAPIGFDGSLAKTSGGWTLLRNSHSDQFGFDNQGNLATTKDSQSRDFTVQNTSAAGRTVLSSYGTSGGRRVNLSYTGDSLVREMDNPASGHHYYTYAAGKLTGYQDPAGPQTAYHYDTGGLLDKITQPDGTTVDLVMHTDGKVQSTTSTAPGGTGQTTSFVYARRTYKTDVTAPSGVRRTYAYDDDWRVTRQYNPDVTPTVTASGDLRDRADQYVNGNQTYPVTIAADEPDGAGLTHLGLERTGGTEITGDDPPCTDTPFDHICPTSFTAPLQADMKSVPEGRQTLHGTATDDEQHHANSDTWDVLVDRTAPATASGFQLSYFDPTEPGASAEITWDNGVDPDLTDGTPGSGIDHTEARYSVDGGPLSAWEAAGDGDVAIFGGHDGNQVTVEVRATDAVGNVSAVGSGSVTLHQQLEDPDLEQIAVAEFSSRYATSPTVASAWLTTQDRANGLSTEIADRLTGGYAGVWFDNDTRRIKVGIQNGADAAPAQQVLTERNLAAQSDIVRTTYTQAQLEQAQPPIEDTLEDLIQQGVVTIGRRTSANSIIITVAAAADTAQRARIAQVANASAVRVTIITSSQASLAATPAKCQFPNCDKPLRAGVSVQRDVDGTGCTAGFLSRSRSNNANYVMTAGHCIDAATEADRRGYWSAYSISGSFNGIERPIGPPFDTYYYGSSGDVGLVQVTGTFWRDDIRPIVYVKRSRATQLDPSYDIRGVEPNLEGKSVCATGAVSGTRCGRVQDTNTEATYGDKIVKNLALASFCSRHGDSGGPAYKRHLAFGLVAAFDDSGNRCVSYFQSAKLAQDLLNVNIITRR